MADNEIAIRQTTDTWVDVVGDVAKLSDYIARTEFVPKAMRGNPAAVAATILTGRELEMGPMTALRSLDVIEGNVQMKTKAILARIFKAGHRVEWFEASEKACEVRIERGDGLSQASVRWTMADAQRAGLGEKPVWRKFPRAMLRNRALSECAELVCPDVILGLEVGDADPAPVASAATVVQVAQAPTVAQQAPAWPPKPATPDPEPTPAPETPAEPVAEPVATESVDLVTQPQLRMLNALLGRMEAAEGRKLDRTERRRLIASMAELPDPEALASAKDLTREQASRAIDALQTAVETVEQADDAEIVTGDGDGGGDV